MYSAPLRRQLASRGSSVCHVDISDKGSDEIDLEGITMDATGYMSDGDVLGKNIRADDITSGSVPLLFLLNTILHGILALCLMMYSRLYVEKEKKNIPKDILLVLISIWRHSSLSQLIYSGGFKHMI